MAASTSTCLYSFVIIFGIAVSILPEFSGAQPTLSFEETQVSGVEGEELNIKIVRSGDLQRSSSVAIITNPNTATESEDFMIVSPDDIGDISFQQGDSMAQLTVRLVDDTTYEQTEQFTIELVNPNGASIERGTILVTITDNDVLYFFEKIKYEVNEKSGSMQVTIKRMGNLSEAANGLLVLETITATSGNDFDATYPTYAFQPGDGLAYATINILDDDLKEGRETFRVRLLTSHGTEIDDDRREAIVAIIDDDSAEISTAVPTSTLPETTSAGICDGNSTRCKDDDDVGLGLPIILIIAGGGVLAIIILVALVFFCFCKVRNATQHKRSESRAFFINNNQENHSNHDNAYHENDYQATNEVLDLELDNQEPHVLISIEEKSLCELHRSTITLKEVIGHGAFAEVYSATFDEPYREVTEVAVKVLKDSEIKTNEFMKELDFLVALETHPNIIKFFGCCTMEDPFYLVFEYAPLGNLRKYLHSVREETDGKLRPGDLVQFALDIAGGMQFISSKNCIHRDLATRNVLLGDGYVCKLSDFGLARDMEVYQQYLSKSGGKLPVRWMALEALEYNTYTIKTDVWSFGVVIWELVTMGAHPYAGMKGPAIIKMLKRGKRLEKPLHSSDDLYQFMLKCWDENERNRPSFGDICTQLEIMLADAKGYVKMVDFQKKDYVYLEPKIWAKGTKDTIQVREKKRVPVPKPKPKSNSTRF